MVRIFAQEYGWDELLHLVSVFATLVRPLYKWRWRWRWWWYHHGDWWLVNDNVLCHTEIVIQKKITQKTPLHRTNFCTAKILYREITRRRFYTQKLLQRKTIAQSSFHTRKLLHRENIAQNSFHTQEFLQRETFTPSSFYTQMILHKTVFTHDVLTHRRLYKSTSCTKNFLHLELHTDAFAHKIFYIDAHKFIPQKKRFHTHTSTFTHRYLFTQNFFYTQTPGLHTVSFTNRTSYAQMLLHIQ